MSRRLSFWIQALCLVVFVASGVWMGVASHVDGAYPLWLDILACLLVIAICLFGVLAVLMLICGIIEAVGEHWEDACRADGADEKAKQDQRERKAWETVDLLIREGVLTEDQRDEAIKAYTEST